MSFPRAETHRAEASTERKEKEKEKGVAARTIEVAPQVGRKVHLQTELSSWRLKEPPKNLAPGTVACMRSGGLARAGGRELAEEKAKRRETTIGCGGDQKLKSAFDP